MLTTSNPPRWIFKSINNQSKQTAKLTKLKCTHQKNLGLTQTRPQKQTTRHPKNKKKNRTKTVARNMEN